MPLFGEPPSRPPEAGRAATTASSSASSARGETGRTAEEDVLTVAELDRRIKRVLEGSTDGVAVSGEIGGVKEVASGHVYFTLKDEEEDASIGCVMYRTAPVRSRRLVAEGVRVVLVGRGTVYAPRGQLQFVAEEARPLGRGALLEALERLKKKLADEGLFARARKRPLPADPHVIGVVTSVDGAALHDIVKVAFRRARVRIVLARAPVQGPQAAGALVRALHMIARHPEVEVVIVGRGGGSAEDLSAFNDEALVRAVAACPVPVVSAVGHEIDTTLVDLAADARAATPSQAAELVVPDWALRVALFRQLEGRLARGMTRVLDERVELVDDRLSRLEARMRRELGDGHKRAADLERRLARRHPSAILASARASLGPLEVRLASAIDRALSRGRRRLGEGASRLEALSPLSVLSRGYAIATREDGVAVRSSDDARVGERISVRLAKGRLRAEVIETIPADDGQGGDPTP